MILWLLAIGCLSILAQVVLLRELSVAFYGSELIYLLAFGVWFCCTALGAAVGRRGTLPRVASIRRLFLLFGLLLPIDIGWVRGMRLFFGGLLGADLSFLQQLAGLSVAILPLGLLSGLLFQWVAKRFAGGGRTLAQAYGIESAGGILGGVAATLALATGMQNFTAAVVCSLIAVGMAVIGVRFSTDLPATQAERGTAPRGIESRATGPWGAARDRPSRRLVLAVACAAALLLVAVVAGNSLDRWSTGWNHPHLLATRDTPYGRTIVTGRDGQLSVFVNGALSFETEGTSAEEFVHLAAVQHADPRHILVLGGGQEGLVREAMRHGPVRVDDVELDRRAWIVVRDLLPAGDAAGGEVVRDGSTPGIRFADPRSFLASVGLVYDLILIGMPEPASAQANRYFTAEFFALCGQRLTAEGVIALRLPGAENLWPPLLLRRTESVLRALRRTFDDVVVLPGSTTIILASRELLTRDPALMADRLASRDVRGRLVSPAYLRYLYASDRRIGIERELAATSAPTNRDGRPICFQYTLLHWLSRYAPDARLPESLERFDRAVAAITPARGILLVVPVALLFLFVRRFGPARRMLLVGMAGCLGMVIESLLILDYQARHGVLYQDLGVLLTLFMAGLTCGALTVHRLAVALRRTEPAAGKMQDGDPDAVNGGMSPAPPARNRWPGAILLIIFVALCMLIVGRFADDFGSSLAWSGGMLLVSGLCVGGLFAHAGLECQLDQRRLVSPLYAADLIGGAVGAVVGGLLVIPLMGLAQTADGLALLGLATLFLL